MSEAADADDVENQRAFKAWADKLGRSSATLAPEVSAEVLAQEFGRLDEHRRDEMCSSAVMIAFDDGYDEISLEHFREAYEETAPEDDVEDSAEAIQEAPPEPHPEPTEETQTDENPPEPEIYDEDNDEVEATSGSQSQNNDAGDDDQDDEDTEPVSEMSRAELEAEVKELRKDLDSMRTIANNNIPLMTRALRNMLGVDEIEDMPDAAAELREAVDGHGDRLDAVEDDVSGIDETITSGQGGKASKVRQIVQLAVNRRTDESVVILDVGDIKDATGVSRRYAYDLADDLPDDHDWCHERSDLAQYGDLEIDKDKQKTAIGIDFDGVHGSKCPVNKFTTGSD